MSREDFKDIDLNNLISDINKEWNSEDDKKIQIATTGRTISLALKGKKSSEETRIKIGNASRGRQVSEETKKKIRLACQSRPKISEESKEKNRLSQIGRKHSEETKTKMSSKQKGKQVSKETVIKIMLSKGLKPIIYEGIEYISMKEASEKLNIPYNTFRKRFKKIKSTKVSKEETIAKTLLTKGIGPFIYEGIEYISKREAARILNIKYSTFLYRVKCNMNKEK